MTDNPPAVVWCPNCGDAVTVTTEVFSVNKHGDHQLKVQFSTQYPNHSCTTA